MYVVCKEHVELAIDKFVDEYEDAPDVVDLKETEFSTGTRRRNVRNASRMRNIWWSEDCCN